MSSLVDEIQACGIICKGLYEGLPITDPPYAELSKGDQVIFNACVLAHGKALVDPKVTALLNLLSPEQQLAYKVVRNADARNERMQLYLEEVLPDWLKKAKEVYVGEDLETHIRKIETKVPLWDATIDTVPLTAQMIEVEKT